MKKENGPERNGAHPGSTRENIVGVLWGAALFMTVALVAVGISLFTDWVEAVNLLPWWAIFALRVVDATMLLADCVSMIWVTLKHLDKQTGLLSALRGFASSRLR